MALRTTEGLVKDVLQDNYDRKRRPNLTAVIGQASRLTDKVSAGAVAKGNPLDAETLRDIETNLAAYFYTVADPLPRSESAGGESVTYEARSFLDIAKMLDTTQTLAALLSAKRIAIGWLGKTPREQVPFWERE